MIKINNKKQHCSLKNTIQRENREDEQYRKLVAALFLSLSCFFYPFLFFSLIFLFRP